MSTTLSSIRIVDTEIGKAVEATRDIDRGQELYSFVGKVLEQPNVYTVQLSETKHLECEGGPEFTAHSCDPNSMMVFGETSNTTKLVATRPIKSGELVSFNYCSTEWDMAATFVCKCKSSQCFGEIKGYKHCTQEQRAKLQGLLSPFLRSKLAMERESELPNIRIVDTTVGKAVEATRDITRGQELYSFVGRVVDEPNVYTVQLSETKHLECEGGLEFTTHSCDPNSRMTFGEKTPTKLVATRTIKKGELVTFNYCSTEWEITSSFVCKCGATQCFGEIKGYKHCTEEQRSMLQDILAPFLRNKISMEKALALPNIRIVETDVGKAVEVTRDIQKDQVLYSFVGRVLDKPNMYTVQLSETKHLECEGGPEFTAHSCDPNSRMVFENHNSAKLVAMRPIKQGELVTFNYCSTEFDMAAAFQCKCGSLQCFGEIRGYKHCTEAQRNLLQGMLSPYLLSQIASSAKKQ